MSIYISIFIILILISSILTITSKNPVTSVLYLINVFVLSSLSLLLLGAEFLSILIVIIYIGAISILFLFVIMMLNLRIVEVYSSLIKSFSVGSFLGFFFLLELLFLIKYEFILNSTYYLNNNYLEFYLISYNLLKTSYSNLYLISDLLYNYYSIFLLIAGLILLTAMIGAILLTVDKSYHDVKNKSLSSLYNFKDKKNRIICWSTKKKN